MTMPARFLARHLRPVPPPPPYVTTATDFDGIADRATRGANLTGIADGKQFIASAFIRIDTETGSTQHIFYTPGSNFRLSRLTSGRIQVYAENVAGSSVLNAASPDTAAGKVFPADGWSHVIASGDLAVASSVRIAVRRNVSPAASGTNQDIDFTTGNFAVAYNSDGNSNYFAGCLAELLFHTAHRDLNVAANLDKFVSAAGKPVFLGADGSLPLGVQPLIYMPDGLTNLGTGGTFTAFGAPAVCSTSPSD